MLCSARCRCIRGPYLLAMSPRLECSREPRSWCRFRTRGNFHGPGGRCKVLSLAFDLNPIFSTMKRKRRKVRRIEMEVHWNSLTKILRTLNIHKNGVNWINTSTGQRSSTEEPWSEIGGISSKGWVNRAWAVIWPEMGWNCQIVKMPGDNCEKKRWTLVARSRRFMTWGTLNYFVALMPRRIIQFYITLINDNTILYTYCLHK